MQKPRRNQGATVLLVGTQLGNITGADGYFTINNVPTETYTIQVSFIGYETQSKFGVVVRSGGTPDLIFELKESIGGVAGSGGDRQPF